MADRSKSKVTDEDIIGLKSFEKLLPRFERLCEVGCERSRAGSRLPSATEPFLAAAVHVRRDGTGGTAYPWQAVCTASKTEVDYLFTEAE